MKLVRANLKITRTFIRTEAYYSLLRELEYGTLLNDSLAKVTQYPCLKLHNLGTKELLNVTF